MRSTEATPAMITADHTLPEHRVLLLATARQSIRDGLEQHPASRLNPLDYPAPLQEPRATFVTLNHSGRLRGCIGHLSPIQSLVEDVAQNAYAAAFRDPRFPPLRPAEWPELELHLSILSPATPLVCASEAELIAQLRPGIDGLIMEDGPCRGTFLPAVWESLPTARLFLEHLKQKAGLPPHHWSATLRISRYTTESFGER